MSLEYVLEKFPIEARLKDGTKVIIRPLKKGDAATLQKFFFAVPEPERLFIERPVTDKKFFADTCAKLDFNQNLTLVMAHGAKMIGWINLHQRQGGWRRHIGRITLLTHPNYRGRDVSRLLLEEIVTAARYLGLWKLEAELNGGRTIALRSLVMTSVGAWIFGSSPSRYLLLRPSVSIFRMVREGSGTVASIILS